MQKGFTLWLTGLSGAGKTTLATLLEKKLKARGLLVENLDGDIIRHNLNSDLGFTPQDRYTNIKRVAFVASLLNRNHVNVIAAFISPYQRARSYCRQQIGNHGKYIEVYVKCPLDTLIQRDVKGLYKKALSGEIAHFTGISDPFEEPIHPEIIVETDQETVDASASKIMTYLEQKGYL